MDIVLVPEEEIYNAVIQALREAFPLLVGHCNARRKEQWIDPFASVLEAREVMDLQPLPLVRVGLDQVRKKSSDPFVELGEFTLILECRFPIESPDFIPYRYAYAFKELFKSDEALLTAMDRFVLEECRLQLPGPGGGSSYPEARYTFRLYRDQLK